MSNKIDIKTLEALRQDSHEAFEEVFITYYGKTKAFIQGYIKSSPDAEELTEDLFVNLWMTATLSISPDHLILTCIQLPEILPSTF